MEEKEATKSRKRKRARKRTKTENKQKEQKDSEPANCTDKFEEIFKELGDLKEDMETNKTKEQILAERKAKKANKQNKKKETPVAQETQPETKEPTEKPETKEPVEKKQNVPVKKPDDLPAKETKSNVSGKPPLSPQKVAPARRIDSSVKKETITAPLRKTPSPVSSPRKTPSPVSSTRKTPSPASSTRKTSSPISNPGKPPSTISNPQKTPGPISSPRKIPSPVSSEKKVQSPVSSPKKNLNPLPAVKKATPSKAQETSNPTPSAPVESLPKQNINPAPASHVQEAAGKSKEQIKAEREAKRLSKKAGKGKESAAKSEVPAKSVETQKKDPSTTESGNPVVQKSSSDIELAQKLEKIHISETPTPTSTPTDPLKSLQPAAEKSKPTTKAERRALQEAQRAAKQKALEEKEKKVAEKKVDAKSAPPPKSVKSTPSKSAIVPIHMSATHKVKLFKHLYFDKCSLDLNVNGNLHPSIIKLGIKYANDVIVGSNARCYAFLNSLKALINDYETPPQKEFGRGLEAQIQSCMTFLQKCRPFAVSMTNALKFIKWQISNLDSTLSDSDNKELLLDAIDTYVRDQIEKAAQAISIAVQQKISNDDVILTYGASSLIKHILEEANRRQVNFRVIVVDSRPDYEGLEMLDSLVAKGIDCTYILINAISFIMPEVTKVMLGAHSLMANGYVMSRVGTAQIALVAKYFNVPVLVCSETHKFSERVQTDAFVYNELGDPDCLIKTNTSASSLYLKDWKTKEHLTPLNLKYDITPPELVTLVVTEIALLPCTSVPVILRVKPAEVA